MLFEVYGMDKNRKMYTDYVEAIPDVTTLRLLNTTGYRFKYNGKDISLTKLIQTVYPDTATTKAKDAEPTKTSSKADDEPDNTRLVSKADATKQQDLSSKDLYTTSSDTGNKPEVAAPKINKDAKPAKRASHKLF